MNSRRIGVFINSAGRGNFVHRSRKLRERSWFQRTRAIDALRDILELVTDEVPRSAVESHQSPRAVAVALYLDSHAIHQREPEIRHHHAVVLQVAARRQGTAARPARSSCSSDDRAGLRLRCRCRANHGIVEQGLVAFLDCLHLVEEVSELLGTVVVDAADLGNLLRIAGSGGSGRDALRDSDFVVGAAALLDSQRKVLTRVTSCWMARI